MNVLGVCVTVLQTALTLMEALSVPVNQATQEMDYLPAMVTTIWTLVFVHVSLLHILDIDECLEGVDVCNQTVSTCVNTMGTYFCNCSSGFTATSLLECTCTSA